MSKIARLAAYTVVIAGTVLVSASLLVAQGVPTGKAQDDLPERGLVSMGVDATYNNIDVRIPPACESFGWTGFRFEIPVPLSCIGLLYDGPANPFAHPSSGAAGVLGTKTHDGTNAILDWTNLAAPVTAAPGSGRDGHFGYQSSCSNNLARYLWHRVDTSGAPKLCTLSDTWINLVPDDSISSLIAVAAGLDVGAKVIVENLEEEETLEIALAAIAWPEEEGPPDTDSVLLARLRPDDTLFKVGFEGVVTETAEVLPGASTSFRFVLPDDATVALARYSVSTVGGEEPGPRYDVYVAFESRPDPLIDPTPVDPTPEATTSETPSIATPTPTPTPTPLWPPLYYPLCYGKP